MLATEKRNFKLKMNLACGTDDLRPVMQHVYFNNGFMIATDAHIIIKAAVQHFSDFDKEEVDLLNGKFLHRNSFKKILSCNMVKITEGGIIDLATNDLYKFSLVDSKYPNYEAVFPTENKPVDVIGLSPTVVSKLFKVLNTNQIHSLKLVFSGANKAIVLNGEGENKDALSCVLMPVMLFEN